MTYNCNRLVLGTPTSIEKERHTHSYKLKHTNAPRTSIEKKPKVLWGNIVFFMCRLDHWFLGCVSLQGWVQQAWLVAKVNLITSIEKGRLIQTRSVLFTFNLFTVVFLLWFVDQKYFFQTFKGRIQSCLSDFSKKVSLNLQGSIWGASLHLITITILLLSKWFFVKGENIILPRKLAKPSRV